MIILNQNLAQLIEQNLSMIVQALNTNISSTNAAAKEQGEVLFNILEGLADPNLLLPPIVAQINLANNRSKHLLIERLSSKTHNYFKETRFRSLSYIFSFIIGLIERVDKVNLI